MALPAQKFREILFLVVYSQDFGSSDERELISLVMKQLSVAKSAVRQALLKAQKITEHQEEIDKLITNTSKEYQLSRIPGIERNILRLSIYEILFDPEIPGKVAISEAIRLARKFSTPESSTFVNALLDQVYKEREEEATPQSEETQE